MGKASNGENDDTRYENANASKEHLTARHISTNLKLGKAQLDKRISPSPKECGSESKEGCPQRTLEDTVICHVKFCTKVRLFDEIIARGMKLFQRKVPDSRILFIALPRLSTKVEEKAEIINHIK